MYRVVLLALRITQRGEESLIVTLTGTDANHDLFDTDGAPPGSGWGPRVTVFHESVRERVAAALPSVDGRVVVVPQSVRMSGTDHFDLRARWPLSARTGLFVFPAGWRAVKNPAFPLPPLGRLVNAIPEIRLLYAGPVLDPSLGEALERELSTIPWACHVGEVPHAPLDRDRRLHRISVS